MIEDKQLFKFSRKICPDYRKYAERIEKSLYYGKITSTPKTSLPVTGLMVEKFGLFCKQDSLDFLEQHSASSICYDACVTPCSVIVALLYLDRLSRNNPDYLASTSSSHVFVVALMVASKYLYDDGEEDEVFNHEWASSAAMMVNDLNEAELKFLDAMEWNLFVDASSFMQALVYMECEVAKREGKRRGFLTYTDILSISRRLPSVWNLLVNLVGSAFLICVVSYAATLVCIVTSVTIVSRVNAVLPHLKLDLGSPTRPADGLAPACNSSANQEIEVLDEIELDDEEENEADFSSFLASIDNSNVKSALSRNNSESPTLPVKRRFHAIGAFTTALLFVSSSTNAQVLNSKEFLLSRSAQIGQIPNEEGTLHQDLAYKNVGPSFDAGFEKNIGICAFCRNNRNEFSNSENRASGYDGKETWSRRRKARSIKNNQELADQNDSYYDAKDTDRVSDIGFYGIFDLGYDSLREIENCTHCDDNFSEIPLKDGRDSVEMNTQRKFSIYPSSNSEPCNGFGIFNNGVCNFEHFTRIDYDYETEFITKENFFDRVQNFYDFNVSEHSKIDYSFGLQTFLFLDKISKILNNLFIPFEWYDTYSHRLASPFRLSGVA